MLIKDLAASWLERLKSRKRKPLKPASIAIFSSFVSNHVNPLIGDMEADSFQNKQLKLFAEALVAKRLSPKTVHEIVGTVQQIIKSAQNDNGDPLYPRDWNREFILENVPDIRNQRQPTVTRQQLDDAMKVRGKSTDKYRVLLATLASTGLRIGELVALRVGDDGEHSGWDEGNSLLAVRTSLYRGAEQKPKTESSIRLVDLSTPVNSMLGEYVKAAGKKTGDYLFSTRKRTPFTPHGLRKQALIPLGISAFHSMRRWRVTHLKMIGTPEPLLKAWLGHSNGNDITARYDKSADDREWRQTWANKCGIGFDLPEISKPAPQLPKSSEPVSHQMSEALEPQTSTYVAVDSDLPEIFFEVRE